MRQDSPSVAAKLSWFTGKPHQLSLPGIPSGSPSPQLYWLHRSLQAVARTREIFIFCLLCLLTVKLSFAKTMLLSHRTETNPWDSSKFLAVDNPDTCFSNTLPSSLAGQPPSATKQLKFLQQPLHQAAWADRLPLFLSSGLSIALTPGTTYTDKAQHTPATENGETYLAEQQPEGISITSLIGNSIPVAQLS